VTTYQLVYLLHILLLATAAPVKDVLWPRVVSSNFYVVIVLRQRVVRWFVLRDGTYRDMEVDASRTFKSTVFPGLWLDAPALLGLNGREVMATLQHGIETPEHAAFVQQLQARRSAS
jgi:hypothetical protein